MRKKASVVGAPCHPRALPGTKCFRRSLLLCVLALAASPYFSFAASSPAPKTVLVLYSFTDRKAQEDVEILKATTRAHVDASVDFHVEYLGSARFEDPGYEKAVTQSLASVYGGKKIDLVIPMFYPALRFALDHRQQLFPGTPIVFYSVPSRRLEGQDLGPGVTGIAMSTDLPGTLDLSLRLAPDTKNAAVIVGAAEPDRYWGAVMDRVIQQHQPGLNVIDLQGLPPDRLLEGVAALPPHTVVFFQAIPEEAAQPVLGTFDIVSTIAQQFQTYCFVSRCLGRGAIGGSYPDPALQDALAGKLAARILSGETPESIPVMQGPPPLNHIDWRQLRRWNIPESALPPGTIVAYRQQTAWERYAKYAAAALLLIIFEAALIIGLLLQRARNRKADLRLRESEQRFRLIADTTPALVWMCDKNGDVTYLNDRRIDFTGRDVRGGLGDVWSTFIHPDDLQNVRTANENALHRQQGFTKEYRLRRRDGAYRWMLDIAAPRVNGNGLFAGFIGSAADITDQKIAREALEKIGGKLIEAQEEERTRIARELHDDICQRLALLSMELEQANRGPNGSGGSLKIEEIRRHCAEIAGDVQALSHKLHSSKLEYLGLVAATRSFCREFCQQHDVWIEFDDEDIPSSLPRDISLSIFRVTQEALQNALKYSGVDQFSVNLRGSAGQIELEVSDQGVGFDVETAMRDKGLGLVSMQERVHLVHGVFVIESTVNGGTRILARVPLVREMQEVESTAERA